MRYLLICVILFISGCAETKTMRMELVLPKENNEPINQLSHNKQLIYQSFKVNAGEDFTPSTLITYLLAYENDDLDGFLIYLKDNYFQNDAEWLINREFGKIKSTYKGLKANEK